MPATVSYPAIKCRQNNKDFFCTVIGSDILKKVCSVSRRDEEPEIGFQRLLNKTRAKEIARYLDNNKGVIPSSIIISAQDSAKLVFDNNSNKIIFSPVKDSFLVIDGQHRLFGLFEAENAYNIPVIIFSKLLSSEEVSLFIDINTTQKGVPSALLLDIKQLAGKETKKEEKQRELFDRLNRNSPLAGLLSSSKSVAGKISRNAFNEATSKLFDGGGPLCDEPVDIIYKGLKNYFEAVEFVFKLSRSSHARLNKTVLFKSVLEIFNDVCTKCLGDKGNLKTESLSEILEPISALNYDDYTGSNKATLNRIITDMRATLKKNLDVREDMF